MTKKNSKTTFMLAIIAILASAIACTTTTKQLKVGDLRTESDAIDLDDAESVRVDIDMAAGELNADGGTSKLLEADFTYNVEELKPEVTYGGGTLSIQTPDVGETITSLWDIDDYRNEWTLLFNEGVPIDMTIDMGAGEADLELGSLSLTRLDLNAGAGNISLNLSDSDSLTRLDVDSGAGIISIDLTGEWQGDLDADIKGGVGELTLRLPSGVGVRVQIEGGLVNVDNSGMIKDGNDYVNNAYGESDVTLRIDISAGVGQINLRLVD
jgi:hypothetical protein